MSLMLTSSHKLLPSTTAVFFAAPLTAFVLGLCGFAAWTVARTKKIDAIEGRVLRMRQRAAAAASMPRSNLLPLPAAFIQRLEPYDMPASGVHDGSDECVVCQESLAEKDLGTIIMLPCHHIFHRACLSEWLGRAGSCPTCRRPLLLPPAQLAREAGHIVGMPAEEADMSAGGVVVIEVGASVTAAAPGPEGSDVEMQLMRPATQLAGADQEAIASATCLSDLKCWQDLPPEEAGVRDNRWLLLVQRSEGQPQLPDGQTLV